MRRTVTIFGPVVLALFGACHDFDTSRPTIERGTVGEEVFGIFCDRMAGQLLREDMSGASFRAVCHKDGAQFADAVDESVLPAPEEGLEDKDGKGISVADQTAARKRALGRIAALVRRRADLIEALDAVFPDADVPVLDLGNPDPQSTCLPGQGNAAVRRLGSELADMLGRMVDLYNDDTVPASTRSMARVLDFFRRTPEAQASVARFTGRDGYRPPEIDIGVARPMMGYSRFRDLAAETLRLVSFDSDPYAADAPQNPDGSRKRVPGAAYPSFSKLLEVAHEELRVTKSTQTVPVARDHDAILGIDHLSRPRGTLELATQLFFVQDASFGGGAPKFIVKRDARGYAALARPIEAPFVDKNKDGLPDVDTLGRFVTVDGNAAPTPFVTATGPKSQRDEFGRATLVGQPLFDYVDTSHNFGAQLLADMRPLVDPQRDVLMNVLGGTYVTFGKRIKAQRVYEPDPGLIDLWKVAHPDEAPPADLGKKPSAVDYWGFDPNASPLVDMVYALGQILGDRGADSLLAYSRMLMTDHNPTLAGVAGDLLTFKEITRKHDEAVLKDKSLFWDEMLDVVSQIVKDRALLEDLLLALADPAASQAGDVFARFMAFNDRISYDRNDINNNTINLTAGGNVPPKTPVNRSQPDTGMNRSLFQRMIHLVADADGVALCNKEGAVVHARGVPLAKTIDMPLFGKTYAECEVLKIDNLSKFYLGSIVGKSQFYFRPKILREGVLGIGAATVDTIQQSSALDGFWDPPDSKTFRPKPELLNRMVFFDFNGDQNNLITSRFMADLTGPNIGTGTCPERIINDPDPSAADASPDGLVHGLRSCGQGEWLSDRHPDVLFMLEHFDALRALAPLVKPFADHDREDLLINLFKTMHRHYQDDKGTPLECDPNPKAWNYCSKSNAVSYEPALTEALGSGIFRSLGELTKVLRDTTIQRCSTLDPRTKQCTSSQPVNGITVMADAAEAMISPDRAKEIGLRDRAGNVTSKRNDGTTNPQVTPIYLLLQALQGIDDAFVEDAKDPANKDRLSRWRNARSALVDQFLRVNGSGASAAFVNPTISRLSPTLIDLIREQMWAHCPDSFVAPYKRCEWARDTLTKNVADSVGSPLFASGMDVLDIIRKDDKARRELQALLLYFTDPASRNEALSSMRAAATDGMMILQNDDDLVPFYHILAEALANSVRDDQGNVLQTGMADSMTSMLSRMAARAHDADGASNCAREIDPNQILTLVMKNSVTPMKGKNGELRKTPFDVVVDVIGDVNRVDPAKSGRLEPADFAAVSSEVNDFLVNKERGLEQFYRIIKNGTR